MTIDIYTLTDPRDQRVYYVGQSIHVRERLLQHALYGKGAVRLWIKEMLNEHVFPVFTIIESFEDVEMAKERERYWIRYYADLNHPLLNLQWNAKKYYDLTSHTRKAAEHGDGRLKGKTRRIRINTMLDSEIVEFLRTLKANAQNAAKESGYSGFLEHLVRESYEFQMYLLANEDLAEIEDTIG